MPRVTVIIPTYNRASLLPQAIDSVLGQTFTGFELIVVDDGSTDNTSEVVAPYQDSRIVYLHQQNRGISAAMNAGLRAARGEYVARLDSDDIWLPGKLMLQVTVLDANPDIGLTYARAQAMDADGKPQSIFWGVPLPYPDDALRSQLLDDCTCNITVMVRRRCLEQTGGFDETMQTNEDWDLWLRVARYCPFRFLDEIVARFRLHEARISNANSPPGAAAFDQRHRVIEKFFRMPGLPPHVQAMRPEALCQAHLWSARCWLSHRNYANSWGHCSRALAARRGTNPPSIAVAAEMAKLAAQLGRSALRRLLLGHN